VTNAQRSLAAGCQQGGQRGTDGDLKQGKQDGARDVESQAQGLVDRDLQGRCRRTAAQRQDDEIARAFGGAPGLIELCGNQIDAGSLAAQCLWLKQHEPYHFQRAARLMTVTVRPGRPNGAASGFLSGIVREPLAGLDAVCPVDPSTAVALSSPSATLAGILAVAEAARADFGGRTAVNLPALTVTVQEMLDALADVAGAAVRARVRFEPDPATARLVGGWPARFDSARSRALGLPAETDFRDIIEEHRREQAPC
jgi:hypothetical protein